MLDLRRLACFVTVAEIGNVSRAADVLHMTQSPLSRQIAQLEDELGIWLFRRERQRLHLTQEGAIFLPEARALLTAADALCARARALASGIEGQLRIGYVPGAMHADIVARMMQKFLRDRPAVEVSLHAGNSRNLAQAIADGTLDIAFIHHVPGDADSRHKLIFVEPLCLITPIARGEAKAHRLRDFSDADFIAMPKAASSDARQTLVEICERAGFAPNIRHEAADPLMVCAMVRAGLGVAIVQKGLADQFSGQVRSLALDDAAHAKMEIHALIGAAPSLAASAMFDMLEG